MIRIGCALLLLLLASCSGTQPATSLDDVGGSWDLASLTTPDGESFEPGSDFSVRIIIDRTDGSLTLFNFCRSFHFSIAVGEEGAVSVSSGLNTLEACIAGNPGSEQPVGHEASNLADSLLFLMDHAEVDDAALVLTGPDGAEMRFTR